jgi:hypothetical protein
MASSVSFPLTGGRSLTFCFLRLGPMSDKAPGLFFACASDQLYFLTLKIFILFLFHVFSTRVVVVRFPCLFGLVIVRLFGLVYFIFYLVFWGASIFIYFCFVLFFVGLFLGARPRWVGVLSWFVLSLGAWSYFLLYRCVCVLYGLSGLYSNLLGACWWYLVFCFGGVPRFLVRFGGECYSRQR